MFHRADEAPANPADIRRSAMNMLARRERLRGELERKLLPRFPDREQVAAVLDQLAEENLLSDARFVESYLRGRVGKGYGPERIRHELEGKGAAAELIDPALAARGEDWRELARAARRKKFGPAPPADLEEKSRQMRFLQYRGFSGDCAEAACTDT